MPMIFEPELQGVYQGQFENKVGAELGRLAPFLPMPASQGYYLVPVGDAIIGSRVDGFDPKAPVSYSAPAREVTLRFERRSAKLHKFSEYTTTDDRTRLDWEAAGINVDERNTAYLARLHADRYEWILADLYQDAANYAPGQDGVALTITPGSSDQSSLWAALQSAINAVTVSNDPAESSINIVAGSSIVSALRVAMSTKSETDQGFLPGDALAERVSDRFGRRVSLFAPSSVYLDNEGAAATNGRVPMWANDFLAVTSTGVDPGAVQGFALTPAINQYRGGEQGVHMFTSIYKAESDNPRGVQTFAESFFDVVSGDPTRGVLFDVTLA